MVFGGLSFYQRKEVKDAIAYLRLAVNQSDEEALKRVINYPKRGIGKSTTDKLAAISVQEDITLFEALNHPSFGAKGNSLRQFAALVKQFEQLALTKDAHEAAVEILDKSGLTKALKGDNSIEGKGRYENFIALLNGVRDFTDDDSADYYDENEEVAEKTLATYLQNIALITDLDKSDPNGDFVTLMSTHAAKGLEFPSVIVVGLEEKLFPSRMALEGSADGVDEEGGCLCGNYQSRKNILL
jgi:Superfamily I DNA and RNA helicases